MKYQSELLVLDYDRRLRQLPQQGVCTIHSLFNNTCNLLWENSLLTVGNGQTLLMPMGLRLQTDSSFLRGALKIGESVSFKEGLFHLPTGSFFSLSTGGKEDLGYTPTPFKKGLNLGVGLDALTPVLFEAPYSQLGVAPVLSLLFPKRYPERKQNIYTTFLFPSFLELSEVLLEGDVEKLKAMGPKVAGCGPGLTPSSDDFLSGLCVGLYLLGGLGVLSNQQAQGLATALTAGAAPCTNFISGQHMLHTGQGFFTKPFHRLCKSFSLLDRVGIEESTVEITGYGSTSGSDMLTGFVTALLLFTQ